MLQKLFKRQETAECERNTESDEMNQSSCIEKCFQNMILEETGNVKSVTYPTEQYAAKEVDCWKKMKELQEQA